MDFNTIELSRFNKSWGSVGYINQGKYYSSDGIRHWVSYAKFGNFNIDYNNQTISSATISFTASGGRYSDPTEIGVYFGLSKTDAETLQKTSNAFAERRYIATIGAHGKNGAIRTITLNSDGLNKFMTYFNSTNPTLVFFSETDRNEHLTETGKYSYNYVQLSNLTLAIETTPKAASFSNLPTQFVLDQNYKLKATALSGSYTYKAILQVGSQSKPFNGVKSGSEVSFDITVPTSFGSEFPTTNSASGSVTIETYSGSSRIGYNTNTITYSVPAYTISTDGIILSNPTDSTYYNNSKTSIVYLLNLSKIGISIKPTTSYGSGLQKVEVIYNDKAIVSSNFPTSGNFTQSLTVNKSGSNTLEIKIYDQRGKSGSISRTYTIYSDLPSLTNLVVARSSNTGGNQFDGKDLKITGTLTNASTILTLKYGTTFGTYNKTASLNKATSYWYTNSNAFEPDIIYYLQIIVTSDRYYKNDKTTRLTQTYLSQLESSAYLMHFNNSGNGVGIGGAAETGKIKLHWPTTFLKAISVDGQATFKSTVFFTGPNNSLPVSQGGTGAVTAEGARASLGITPANIGALSLGGGTLTNTLTVPYLQIYKADNKWPALALGWENNAYYGSIFASMKNDTDTQKTMAGFFIKQTGSKYGEYYTLVPNARNDDTVKHTWYRIHSDKTHYPEIRNNEEIIFTNEVFMGYITTSAKDLYITVPIAKSLRRVESVSITQMEGRLRCDGHYAIGSAEANASFFTNLANSSATIKTTTNSVIIYINYSKTLSSTDYCNNKPCVAAISTMKLKFTNSSYVE